MLSDALREALILDHARARHGYGLAGQGGVHELVNPTCGDRVTVEVVADGDSINALRWEGRGCEISTAAASVLADLAPGRTRGELARLWQRYRRLLEADAHPAADDEELLGDALAFTGIARYPTRVTCATLAWLCLREALGEQTAAVG